MDKHKIARLMTTSEINVVTLPSAASRTERDQLIRAFTKSVDQFQNSEVILVMIRPK